MCILLVNSSQHFLGDEFSTYFIDIINIKNSNIKIIPHKTRHKTTSTKKCAITFNALNISSIIINSQIFYFSLYLNVITHIKMDTNKQNNEGTNTKQ